MLEVDLVRREQPLQDLVMIAGMQETYVLVVHLFSAASL